MHKITAAFLTALVVLPLLAACGTGAPALAAVNTLNPPLAPTPTAVATATLTATITATLTANLLLLTTRKI